MQHKLPFESEHRSRILTKSFIAELINDHALIAEGTHSESSLDFSSYDVRVGCKVVFSGTGEIKELKENDVFTIAPGAYVGIISREKLNMPLNVLGMIGTKRRFSYEGLILLTGNLIDPGYQGHLLFTIYNASNKPAFLQFEEKLCTVIFHQVECAAPRKFHDTSLVEGKFPAEYVRNIGQTDPTGYAKLQQEVGKIQDLMNRISRLESEYNDVRGPIKDLTKLVHDVNEGLRDVKVISEQNTVNIQKLTDASSETSKQVSEQKTQIAQGDVNIKWLKWGITALLGSLAIYWIINAVFPLLKQGLTK